MSKNDSTTPTNDEAADAAVTDSVEKKMRVVIERHPNPNTTTYHVNRRLTESLRGLSFVSDSGEVRMDRMFSSMDGASQDVEPFAQLLAEKLFRVPGVLSGGFIGGGLSISSYEICVSKGTAFSDADIEPAVLAIIAENAAHGVDELHQSIKSERHLLARYQERDHQTARFGGILGFGDDIE